MQKIDVISEVLSLVLAMEHERARELIKQKQRKIELSKTENTRLEISKIIENMKEIDKQLISFKIKKIKFQELSPDTVVLLESYMEQLELQRKVLAQKKKLMAKQR